MSISDVSMSTLRFNAVLYYCIYIIVGNGTNAYIIKKVQYLMW